MNALAINSLNYLANMMLSTLRPLHKLIHEQMFISVALPGAAGGFITYQLGNSLNAEIMQRMYPGISISMVLGALAGMIFVVVLTNVDKTDTPRLIALAFLSGFAYPPILEAGLTNLGVNAGNILTRVQVATNQKENVEIAALQAAGKQEDEGSTANLDALSMEVNNLADSLLQLNERERAGILEPLLEELQERLDPEQEALVLSRIEDALSQSNIEISDYFASDEEADGAYLPDPLSRLPRRLESELIAESSVTIGNNRFNVHWIPVNISYASQYEIRVTSNGEGDLVAGIYDAVSLRLLAENDDYTNADPQITVELASGNYVLRVSEYFSRTIGQVEITLQDSRLSTQIVPTTLPQSTVDLGTVVLGQDYPIEEIIDGNDFIPSRWIGFSVDTQGRYQILITSSDEFTDLVAELFAASDSESIVYGDDFGFSMNPLLDALLISGDYLLRVSEFGEDAAVGAFTITFQRPPQQTR